MHVKKPAIMQVFSFIMKFWQWISPLTCCLFEGGIHPCKAGERVFQ
jgi:hypothetical protein